MQHWHLQFTEHNGGQNYTYDYIFRSRNKGTALKRAKSFLKRWYDNNDNEKRVWKDWRGKHKMAIDFFDGEITIEIEYIVETTIEQFKTDMVNQYHFGVVQ